MAGVFFTTPALQIFLLWKESPLTNSLANLPISETWISPLSHAILRDTFLTARSLSDGTRKRGLRAIEQHRRQIEASKAPYLYPNDETIRIWSEIRGTKIDIPAYTDGVASYPMQQVGPDELLVFATAAAYSKPLIGPAPTDPETIEFLADCGVTFTQL